MISNRLPVDLVHSYFVAAALEDAIAKLHVGNKLLVFCSVVFPGFRALTVSLCFFGFLFPRHAQFMNYQNISENGSSFVLQKDT